MLSGAVTGNSSSWAGTGFIAVTLCAGRGLTAASATLRGGEASADLTSGFAAGVAKDGFGFGIGTGSIADMTIGAGGGAALATF